MQDGKVLGIAAGNSVNRTEFAYAECSQTRRCTLGACVAVGRVRGIEFVGCADPTHSRMGDDAIEKRQVVVAWHAEQMIDTDFGKPVHEMIANGRNVFHGSQVQKK
jgi:hypothetical protein